MTGSLAHQTGFNQSCTYQHLIGDMLIRLNKLSEELKLTHSEYRVMASIIGLYNKGYGKSFPSIDYLTKICCMGKATIIKALKRLTELNLIEILKQPGQRNNYYIGERLLTGIQIIPPRSSACKTAHDKNKQNRTNKIIHENKQNHDDDLKNTERLNTTNQEISHNRILHYSSGLPLRDDNVREEILMKLASWNFVGGEFVLRKHSVEKIKRLLEIVKEKNPSNKGAYFRSLLNLGDTNIPETKKEVVNKPLNEGLESVKKVLSINEARLSREEIIKKLVEEGKEEEANNLAKIWKMQV